MTAEEKRLEESKIGEIKWKKWGPYVTERQWGTVREDYSENGDAWSYLTHDMARSKAYRWGEDGIAGICDENQILCFGLALWNKKDQIIKERLFGLTNKEGNHGEDVKELYYYLDSTPTHSYMKMLYKYPQSAFPYNLLLAENSKRNKDQPEFELIDTGIFDEDKYFDVFVEYVKASEEEILIKITVHNRAGEDASLHVLPQLWFRNTWAWGYDNYKPEMSSLEKGDVAIDHKEFDKLILYVEDKAPLLFCDNETNIKKLYRAKNVSPFLKDGINDFLVEKKIDAINKEATGTKVAINYDINVKGKSFACIRLRLTSVTDKPFDDFDDVFTERIKEADEFYNTVHQAEATAEEKMIQRQALAGLLWNKQFYYYNIQKWLSGDPSQPAPPQERFEGRNHDWVHLNNSDIVLMPDTWEYPWYAAWDLAFHCITLSLVDSEFAKKQLILLTRDWYMHPSGQLPAYEWMFSGVNPPVHAKAAWSVYRTDQKNNNGKGDVAFLEAVFHRLLINFTWWVNRKDQGGDNIFQGGFLGLDNIGVFDRNEPLPNGDYIDQADGTSWMAMYSLNMMRIALELSQKNPVYQDMATKFFEHFLYIADAMNNISCGDSGLWDEDDSFFYDALKTEGSPPTKLKVRSLVGVIPLFAVEILDDEIFKQVPEFAKRLKWFLNHRPRLANLVSRWQDKNEGEKHLLSLLRGHRMKRILFRVLDENEFLSEYGVRSLSKVYEKHPYEFTLNSKSFCVQYNPAESTTGMFGGNSNWRGPIWMPANYLIIESIRRFHNYYGDDFKVECPTGSGQFITLNEIADFLSKRLVKLFMKDQNGCRPFNGEYQKLDKDVHFEDKILFYEYFDGDNGKGLGASHQTGWTALIANLLPAGKE